MQKINVLQGSHGDHRTGGMDAVPTCSVQLACSLAQESILHALCTGACGFCRL